MSTTERTGAPDPAAVTLTLRDPIAVRAAIIRELVTSARYVADVAGHYTLDPLNSLGDDTVQVSLEHSLDIAASLLANVVTIDELGVFETDDAAIEPPPLPPVASTPRPRRTRCARRPAATLAIAAPASIAGIALMTRAARRR